MKVLAIDASSTSTGIAIFQDLKLIHYENITCPKYNSFKRIIVMRNAITKIFEKYRPTNVIIQDVLPEQVNHNQQTYTTLKYLQAAIILSLYEHFSFQNVQLCTASHWRSVCGIKTGPGRRRDYLKKESMRLVKQQYGLDVNDDISDAICIGLAYVQEHASAF